MSGSNRPKIVLIKLAAIGDVALACRAIRDFVSSYDAPLDLHWIIDGHLKALAATLLKPVCRDSGLTIQWHAVDAGGLFKGSTLAKIEQTLRLLRTITALKPDHILLLHRDWRYRLLLKLASKGHITGVSREQIPELEAYARVFNEYAAKSGLAAKSSPELNKPARRRSGKIGILIGGAQNQKVTFREKKWPHLKELLHILLSRSDASIVMFGGPDDVPALQTLLEGIPAASERITDLVGKLPLDKVPDALAELDCFISIDSGLAHIASAVMTAEHQRIITLFGPTDPRIWAPSASQPATAVTLYKAAPCSPCYQNDGRFRPCKFKDERFQHCMTDISAEEVFKALAPTSRT